MFSKSPIEKQVNEIKRIATAHNGRIWIWPILPNDDNFIPGIIEE